MDIFSHQSSNFPLPVPPGIASDSLGLDPENAQYGYFVGPTALNSPVGDFVGPTVIDSPENLSEQPISITGNSPPPPPRGRSALSPVNPFESGLVEVGDTGQVTFDFLNDGGHYKGEVAVFNIEGMGNLALDSSAFVEEALRRSLSGNSDDPEGYIVISDPVEKAREDFSFDGFYPNQGEYLGPKTFQLTPGGEYGLLQVPNGTVQEAFDAFSNGVGPQGDKQPLFSMATANPNDAFHVGQIADVTGDSTVFVMEDKRVDTGSDRDYNDIIFRVAGARITAPNIKTVINPNLDWTDTPEGQAFFAEVQPPAIEVALGTDTGTDNTDSLTSEVTVVGTVSTTGEIASVRAGLDNMPVADFLEVKDLLGADGSFSLDRAKLEEIAGAALADGAHSLYLQSVDDKGNISDFFKLSFELDTAAPVITGAIADDTGVSNSDGITASPAIAGSVTGESTSFEVSLDGENFTTVALEDDGSFALDRSELETVAGAGLLDGNTTVYLKAGDAAGNESSSEISFTLDSANPALTFSENLANAVLVPGSRLAGTANGTGSDLVFLSYAFEGVNEEVSIELGDSGDFEKELDLTTVPQGAQTLIVKAIDRAGNETVSSYSVTVEAALDTTAPEIDVQVQDTGELGDSITSVARVEGQIVDTSDIKEIRVGLDTAPEAELQDITAEAWNDGRLVLDAAKLQEIAGGDLPDGDHVIQLEATDIHDNTSTVEIPFTLDTAEPVVNLAQSLDNALLPGSRISGNASDNAGSGVVELSYRIGDLPEVTVEADETGAFDVELDLSQVANGQQSLTIIATDKAGNVSTQVFPVQVGPVLPPSVDHPPEIEVSLVNDTGESDSDLITSDPSVNGRVSDSGEVAWLRVGLDDMAEADFVDVAVEADGSWSLDRAQLEAIYGDTLPTGSRVLRFQAADENGNISSIKDFAFTLEPRPLEIVEISPALTEEHVSLDREVLIRFSAPVNPDTVSSENLKVIALGGEVAGRWVVNSTGEFARFFPDNPWAESAEIRIEIDGEGVLGVDGGILDADANGTPGGDISHEFRTTSMTRIPDTDVWGYVYDSYSDGETPTPIVGATIRVDGLPEASATTDENGFFILEDMPGPEFFVHIDGSTATNAPAGRTYPTVGKPFHSVPGQSVQLTSDGTPFDIYLPSMAVGDLVSLSATETQSVGFGAAGKAALQEILPNVDAAAWDRMSVEFAPNSAVDKSGKAATQATVIPVPADRIPGPLPLGITPQLVVSIQALNEDGLVNNFDTPAAVTFPNVEGLAPGEQGQIMSFNHDSGRWESVGTATVTDDGLAIASDPGVGITAPGWHALVPFTVGDPYHPELLGLPPAPTVDVPPIPEISGVQDYFFYDDSGELTLSFGNRADRPNPNEHPSSHPDNAGATPMMVIIEVGGTNSTNQDGQHAEEFIDLPIWLEDGVGAFDVRPGEKTDIKIDVQELIGSTTEDALYGTKLTIKLATRTVGGGFDFFDTQEMFVYRYVDAADSNHDDQTLEMLDTVNDGAGGDKKERPLDLKLSPSVAGTTIQLDDLTHFSYSSGASSGTFTFDPTATQDDLSTTVRVRKPDGVQVGQLTIEGDGIGSSNTGALGITKPTAAAFGSSLSFRKVTADGPGGQEATENLLLTNFGKKALSLSKVSFSGSSAIKVAQPATTVLAPGQTTPLAVTFDPTEKGEQEATLTIENDGNIPLYEFRIEGVGQSADGDIEVTTDNNNVGGLSVTAAPLTVAEFATIGNSGNSALTVREISINDPSGKDQFSIARLANPLVLNPGDTYDLDVTFDAKFVGLQRAEISIFSDDPDTPIFSQTVVGTGLAAEGSALKYGKDYVAIDLESGPPLRTRSLESGEYEFFLRPNSSYNQAVFDPDSGLISHNFGTTSRSGQPTHLPTSGFEASTAPDSDGDGLPDDVEWAIGTSQSSKDTDNDGIDDFVEIQQNIEGLGVGFPTGIIASLNLPPGGVSEQVVPEGEHLYVATGGHGLAIVDSSEPNNPIQLGQIDLDGYAYDVGVDSNLQIAAVATSTGLELVDISDPNEPKLKQTVSGAAREVEVANGLAYAANRTSFKVVNLENGAVIQNLTLPGTGSITGLAREGTELYAYVSRFPNSTLSVIDISAAATGGATLLGSVGGLNSTTVNRIFASDDTVWLPGGGIHTVDVSDPSNPQRIRRSDSALAARSIALNGPQQNLGVLAADFRAFVEVYDTSDPNNTNSDDLLQRFPLSSNPYDVAIGRGIAYVGTENGLEVLNYSPFDTEGKPPTPVTIASPLTGAELVAGASLAVSIDAEDDFQLSHVELLANGETIAQDVSYPFDFITTVPEFNLEDTAYNLQVRAFDTAGNSTLSNTLVWNILDPNDETPPTASITSNIAGNRVEVGERIQIDADVQDDVAVSNVELLVNGEVADNDVSAPFEFVTVAPEIAPGAETLEVRVRATDTGGNTTESNVLAWNLFVPDLEPPTISISDRAVDSDPFNAGLQVAPLDSVPIRLDASDNVGIGGLELLVDGQVVATNNSDSLEYNVTAPDVLTGTVILNVQGRATDTNGNTALSDERNFVVHRLFTPF
ncbi:MAG: choice-of-anchor D domain-containing protein [Oscillatoria sp. SIO1A7]|nr:choice-of-anchor D domain-containing protein [Oscillatoria sp. SIO1A7]